MKTLYSFNYKKSLRGEFYFILFYVLSSFPVEGMNTEELGPLVSRSSSRIDKRCCMVLDLLTLFFPFSLGHGHVT